MPVPQGPKQSLFEHLAVVARALGHGARLELLDFLAQGERSVEDLAKVSGLSVANTSKHLQQLKAAGLVQAQRDGKYIRYTLGDERVLDAVAALRAIAQAHLGAVEDLVTSYLRGRDALEPVPAADLLERVRDGLVTVLDVRPPEEFAQGHVAGALNVPGLVTVLDVRPPEEFAQGHVAGALNVPLDRLQERLKDLPPDREVVAYCRGPWCVLSFEAVARLREAGFEARRLQDGLPEWRRAGLPVVSD